MTDAIALEKILLQLEKTDCTEWLDSLQERKLKELQFHDSHRNPAGPAHSGAETYQKTRGNKKYYATTQISYDYVGRWIEENARGMVFLDYCCGDGFNAIRAARAGARLAIGLDISPISVQVARESALEKGISHGIHFIQADAEQTGLPDGSIDCALCSGVLHHVDLSFALPELRRILAPGGKILVGEALAYNPAIWLYRRLTPSMRTAWETEHILNLKDVAFAARFFDVRNIRFWHISSVLAAVLGNSLLPAFNSIDRFLTRVPGIRLMAWIFTFEMHQRQTS